MFSISNNNTQVVVTSEYLFNKYDYNLNGQLERNQIKHALKDLNSALNINANVLEGDVDRFLDDYDVNNDGKISKEDFASMSSAIKYYTPLIRQIYPDVFGISVEQIFKRYDHDKNGILEINELIQCLQSVFDRLGVHETANINDVIQFFKDYDTNNDGKISREDFANVKEIRFQSLTEESKL